MAQPSQQDFQQLRAAINALTQALPNTNNALAINTQVITNPPLREGMVAELPYFYGGNQDPDLHPLGGIQMLNNGNPSRIITWTGNNNNTDFVINFPNAFRTQTLVEIWTTELEQRHQQPGEDVNTYAAALQELYRRVETNAFVYPEVIKARKFVNGLLPDLYVTVKSHNDQTWNGIVDQAKAYELTHQDQYAVNAYLNQFAPFSTNTQMKSLYKAIQELTKQVQQLSTGKRGYQNNYSNNNYCKTNNHSQQPLNTQSKLTCYACATRTHSCPIATITSPIHPTRKCRQSAVSVFKLKGVPHESECTSQNIIPSNLTLFETYPATRITQSKTRLDPMEGIMKDKPKEEETVLRSNQQVNKPNRLTKTVETKKNEPKKVTQKNIGKKPSTTVPVNKMVEPYIPHQFFDQKADITNDQLLSKNPKFGLMIAKQLRKPVVQQKSEEKDKKINTRIANNEVLEEKGTPKTEDLMQTNMSRLNDDHTPALYCEVSIKHIRFPLIVDLGLARSIISLSLLKNLNMEITKASKTVMVNVNGEYQQPLGAVSDIPLKIYECIIPLDAIIADANSYAAIVGNNWLHKTKAILDYNNNMMTIKWNGEVLEAVTEYKGMPQHIVNIKALNVKAEENAEEEVEEEVEESKKEYENDDKSTQEQLFCNTQLEAVLKTEDLKEGNFIENKYSYQYEEIEKGKFHTSKLNNQQHTFNGFMKRYKNLFAWNSDDFKRTSVITYTIDTGDALSIKQRFCWTSCQNQLFIKEKIQQLLKTGLIVPLSSKWTSSIAVVKKKNDKERLYIDCCINKIIKKDSYPLHQVDDVLETLSGAQQFSSLDLASWFWQVKLSKKDHEKLTFITRFRIYEFTAMHFGFCDAPATFQWKMAPYECILEDLC
ncbi:retroviral-like aspartic protease 1 [Rhizophagus clarus]|uniref:Retroviral-like aspartic protease 1 n=1 Tax=Rhizophagus clarus TaxID=94130 RepID=A0A8H3M9F0_9GLOM|nr:retroviral-like aspartic protease 1 [Rhizophagus clarus]